MWGWGRGFCCSLPQYGRGKGGERRDTHRNTHTHTGTYTRMLHLPFSDLPLEKCPISQGSLGGSGMPFKIVFLKRPNLKPITKALLVL